MKLEEINIDDISISEFNVRKSPDDEELNNLANSIKEHGLLQPIIVTLKGDNKYELIAGQRRLNACESLDWKSIPANIIENTDDLKILTLSTVENLQRLDLNKAEKMEAFTNIYEMYNKEFQRVAKATGYSIGTVKRYIELNAKIDPTIKAEIKSGERDVSLEVLDALVIAKNIPQNEQSKILDTIGIKRAEVAVANIQRFDDAQDREEIHDELKGEEEVKELIKLFLTERRDELSIMLEDFDIKGRFSNLFREIDKIQYEWPLIKIFNLKAQIGEFLSKFWRIMRPNSVESYNRYKTQVNFKILLEEYKKNNVKYSSEFKGDFFRILKNLSNLDLFRQIIKNFDSKLID